LEAFLSNFCAPTAKLAPQASAAGVFRETVTQPGVYWMLDAPFADIIGLYSNIAEGPGDLEGANGDKQQIDWLNTTLAAIATARKSGKRKALIIAVHHLRSARRAIVGALRCWLKSTPRARPQA